MVADLCPSICCTTFTFAPDAIASDAAVWMQALDEDTLQGDGEGCLLRWGW